MKGYPTVHREYLERVVASERWLDEHAYQTREHYVHQTEQLRALDRHMHDPRRKGGTALRGNDVARLLSLLASVPNVLVRRTNDLLTESIEILKAEFHEDMALKVDTEREHILKNRGFPRHT